MKKFGEFILKNRVILIIGIVIITILCFLHLPDLRMEDDETTWFPKGDPILKTHDEFKQTFVNSEFVVVAYELDNPFTQRELTYLSHLSRELEKVPYVNRITSLTDVDDIRGTEQGLEIEPLIQENHLSDEKISNIKQRIDLNPFFKGNLISYDYKTVGIVLSLNILNEDEKKFSNITKEIISAIRKILQKEQEKTDRTFHLGGSIITDAEASSMMEKDMQKFFPLSMLLVAVVLFLIFRNLSSIIFPLITVFLGLVWTLGLKGMVNSPITPISTTLFALITVIGIANSVHLISHFRIEISVIKDKKRALMETYYRAGKPCLFTSLTTAMGFGSLSISNIPAIRNLGIFAGFGIMSVFMLSMILVPLGLLLIKTSPKVTGKQAHKGMENLLKRIGGFNLKCSKLIIIFGFLIVLIMITGIPRIHVEGSMMQYLKEGSRLRKDAEFFDRNLTGISSTEVIIRGDQDLFKNPAVLKKIDGLQKLVENHPKVSCSYSLVDYIKLINRALNNGNNTHYTIPETQEAIAQSLLLYEMSGGTEIDEYVTIDYDMARISMRTNQMNEKERKVLLTTVQTYINKNFKKINTEITGLDNMVHKVTERIVSTQIQSLGLAFLVILGLMLLLFGLRGGLVSVLPNMFPIVFVLGFMGYAGFSLNIATAIIASIAIGIVVDDTIHYFSHFRHEFEITGNREQSMKNALQKVGRALCFTSLILVLGFAIFLLSETRILMDYGILSGIAVIMALLGDLFIGPVLLTKLRVFKK